MLRLGTYMHPHTLTTPPSSASVQLDGHGKVQSKSAAPPPHSTQQPSESMTSTPEHFFGAESPKVCPAAARAASFLFAASGTVVSNPSSRSCTMRSTCSFLYFFGRPILTPPDLGPHRKMQFKAYASVIIDGPVIAEGREWGAQTHLLRKFAGLDGGMPAVTRAHKTLFGSFRKSETRGVIREATYSGAVGICAAEFTQHDVACKTAYCASAAPAIIGNKQSGGCGGIWTAHACLMVATTCNCLNESRVNHCQRGACRSNQLLAASFIPSAYFFRCLAASRSSNCRRSCSVSGLLLLLLRLLPSSACFLILLWLREKNSRSLSTDKL